MKLTSGMRLIWLAMAIAWSSIPLPLSAQETQPAQVEFRRDIIPIFQAHCLDCHSDENVEGNLNLLSRSSIEEGGFSGLPIVGTNLEVSELYLRITSDDDEYRMPKHSEPLPDREVDIIAKWIQQGGDFGETQPLNPAKTSISPLADAWLWVEAASRKPSYQYSSYVAIPLVALLLVALFVTIRTRGKTCNSVLDASSLFRLKPLFLIIVFGGLLSVIGFLWGSLQESRADQQKLNKELDRATRRNNINSDGPPIVPYPMHPPRLGGVYYRGNDERSENLFNQGFYRTAEFVLELVDTEGNVLSQGDPVPQNGMGIRLRMKRSAGTERGMFDKRTLGTTFVSAKYQNAETDSDRKFLQPVQPGEEWSVVYPIAYPTDAKNENHSQTSGVLYVFYGPLNRNRIHYAITYGLNMDAGVIGRGSILWMGSAYNLNGRVLLPTEDEILLDHWFDFRPIPEIPDRKNR